MIAEVGRPAAGISREGHKALLSYPWPGNVRELRNALERATILCDGSLIAVARLRSITRSQLYYRMQKHGLENTAGRPSD